MNSKRLIHHSKLASLCAVAFLLLVAFILPARAQSSDDGQTGYIVAIDADYAPYEYVDAAGRVTGFTVALLNEISNLAGVTFHYVPMDWPDALAGLDNGSVDLVNMIQTPERSALYEFSEPHSQIAQAIFSTRESNIGDLEALRGHTVALQANDVSLESLAERSDFTQVIVRNKEQGMLMLNAGKVDAFFVAEQSGVWLKEQYDLENVFIADAGLFSHPFGFAARKGNTALISLLNSNLEALKASGEYDALVEQWLVHDPVRRGWLARHEKEAIYGFVVLIALMVVFVGWIYALRKAMAQRTQALRKSEARYRAFYENVHDVIYWTDYHGIITDVSPSVAKHVGYRPQEVIGHPVVEFFCDPQDYAALDAAMERDGAINDFEILLKNKEGRPIPTSITSKIIFDAQGQPIATEGVLRDISAHKRAEQALQEYSEQLEEMVAERTAGLKTAIAEMESFAYSVAHDLRSPLRGIDGWSLALLEDYGDRLDAQGRRYLDRVRAEAQHMGELIDGLLALARVSRVEMQRQTVDLAALARSIAARLRTEHPQRPVEWTIQEGLTAQGDAALLEIALTNLLDNAWKFSGRRDLARIEFGQTEFDGRLVYFVRDNGVGFDMAYVSKLFGAFQRLHPPAEFAGTGIGLATVQRIVQRHGGRVWAEAEPDRGATFYFTIEEEI